MQGQGNITVNGKDYKAYFPQTHVQGKIVQPFQTVEVDNNIYDVRVNVDGGATRVRQRQFALVSAAPS